MSTYADATIVDVLKQVDIDAKPRVSRFDRRERLLSAFYVIARQYAEMTYLRIRTMPEFVDGTMTADDAGARLNAAFDQLESAAFEELERRGMGDNISRLLAQPRLINGFFVRFGELAPVKGSGCA